MVLLMGKDLIGGTSSTRTNWISPGHTWLRSCTLIKSKYQISLWSTPHPGLSIQFTAGLIRLLCSHFSTLVHSIFLMYIVCFIILIKLYIFSNITIKGLTILAPVDSPNTDGIDPGKVFVLLLYTYLHCLLNFDANLM